MEFFFVVIQRNKEEDSATSELWPRRPDRREREVVVLSVRILVYMSGLCTGEYHSVHTVVSASINIGFPRS